MPERSVSIVIVSFNSEDTLGAALSSVPDGLEAVVVEQSPVGTAAAIAQSVRPTTRVIRSGANRGFGAGCNLGAANVSGDVVVFLNPDACLERGSFDELAQAVRDRGGAIVGPALLDEDGRDISEARPWTTPARRTVDLLLPKRLQPAKWALDVHPEDVLYRDGGSVDYVQGACLAVGRDAFFRAGGFDESFFLYGEEEFLARRLVEQGLHCYFLPSVVVRHVGQTSTSSVAGFATQQLFRSTVRGFRMHQGPFAAVRGALAVWLALAVLAVTTPIREVVGFRRGQGVRWCLDAMKGAWSGLSNKRVDPPRPDVGEEERQWV